MKAVKTEGLTKEYNGFIAVDSLDLEVEEGEIFGLLGPNGAGKTTTILMLLGLTEPTRGRALVLGHDPLKEALTIKRMTGYLPENVGFYEDLSARENLRYIADLNSIPRRRAEELIDDALRTVGLLDVADRPAGTFSRGMRQRLGLAEVLIKEPRLAILDEPTAGIDPEGASHILDLIKSLNRERGITFIISSHLLYQIQRICSRVGIMSGGKLIACGTVEELGDKIFGKGITIELETNPDDSLIKAISRIKGVKNITREGNRLYIRSEEDIRSLVMKEVYEGGYPLFGLRLKEHALEEIYLRYFGEG